MHKWCDFADIFQRPEALVDVRRLRPSRSLQTGRLRIGVCREPLLLTPRVIFFLATLLACWQSSNAARQGISRARHVERLITHRGMIGITNSHTAVQKPLTCAATATTTTTTYTVMISKICNF